VEDLEIDSLLKKLEKYDLTPLQRVILSSTGTVQSLLTAIFQRPVVAKIIAQIDTVDSYIRWARLVYNKEDKKVGLYNPSPDEIGTCMIPYIKEETVCLAESIFPHKSNDPEILKELRKGDDGGIGYVLAKKKIVVNRTILGIYADDHTFARNYQITGKNINCIITEVFPRGAFDF
jgi:hypothetical protein